MKKRCLSALMAFILCLTLLPNGALAAEKPSAWAEADVNKAIAAQLVPQTLQARYTQAITRAEFTALVVALHERVTGNAITGRTKFNDTTDVNVEKAAAIGVVSGTGNNNFSPNAGLTREQAATMLARLAESAGKPLTKQAAAFADQSSISSWAVEAVGQMQGGGIMGGVGNNAFDAQGAYTREQSIVTVLRLYDFVRGDSSAAPAASADKASSYATYANVTPAFPDFTAVTGIPLQKASPSPSNTSYYYGQNTVTASDVQKYLDTLRALGFTPYSDSSSFTLDETNTQAMYFIPPGVQEAEQKWLTTRIGVSPMSQPNFSVQLLGVTVTPDSAYPMYADYPFVPDFGAIFGVEAKAGLPGGGMQSYYYETTASDEAAKNIAGCKETLQAFADKMGRVTSGYLSYPSLSYYEYILSESGFTPALRHDNGGKSREYWEGYGYSILVTIYTRENYLSPGQIAEAKYQILIQKL